jgi:hypothetical protein
VVELTELGERCTSTHLRILDVLIPPAIILIIPTLSIPVICFLTITRLPIAPMLIITESIRGLPHSSSIDSALVVPAIISSLDISVLISPVYALSAIILCVVEGPAIACSIGAPVIGNLSTI